MRSHHPLLALLLTLALAGCGQSPSPTAAPVGGPQAAAAALPAAVAAPAILTPVAAGVSRLEATPPGPEPGLTEEETGLRALGLLPGSYARLKAIALADGVPAAKAAARAGKRGPFSVVYGDPVWMLNRARQAAGVADLRRLAADARAGDVLHKTYNRSDDPIAVFTRGPWIHTALVVAEGDDLEMIEAVGYSERNAQDSSMVRRSMLLEHMHPNVTVRLVRVVEQLPEAERAEAVSRAHAYCVAQLGKPYDYSLTNRNDGEGLRDAFYCSELTYQCYADPDGAGIEVPIDKSSRRDEVLLAFESLIDALEPADRAALVDRAAKLFNSKPRPSTQQIVAFLVHDAFPVCALTRDLATTSQERSALERQVLRLLRGEAFPRFSAELAEFREAQRGAAFDRPVLGKLRAGLARTQLGLDLARDAHSLVSESRMSPLRAAKVSRVLVGALLPHSENLSRFAYGPGSPRTRQISRLLDGIDWLKAHAPGSLFDGGLMSLPGRAPARLKDDFVSPTDTAWADLPHSDYNVRPGYPVDKPR